MNSFNRDKYQIKFKIVYKADPQRFKNLTWFCYGETGHEAAEFSKRQLIKKWPNVAQITLLSWLNVEKPGSDYFKIKKDGTIITSEKK